jgi:hypothetical protein
MAHYATAHWQGLGTGSGYIEVVAKAEFSQDFSEVFAHVQSINTREGSTGQWFVAQWEPSATEWFAVTPCEGLDRCHCGSKYWDGLNCHSCGDPFRPSP